MPKGIRKSTDPARQKRRQSLFQRAIDDVEFVSALEPHFSCDKETLRRIGNGETRNPHRTTDEEMARYLRVSPESYENYLSGAIDLESLWSRRGENVPKYAPRRADFHEIQGTILALKPSERFDLLQWLLGIIRKDSEPAPALPVVVEFSPEAIDRLRALFRLSIAADELEPREVEIDPALREWLIGAGINIKFPAETYEPLLSYLYRVTGWVEGKTGVKPRLDYSRTYEGDLLSLRRDLETVEIESFLPIDNP